MGPPRLGTNARGETYDPLIKSGVKGVAQVLDDWAIPFSFRTSGAVGKSVLFIPSQSVSASFLALLNTGITPAPQGRTPPTSRGSGLL